MLAQLYISENNSQLTVINLWLVYYKTIYRILIKLPLSGHQSAAGMNILSLNYGLIAILSNQQLLIDVFVAEKTGNWLKIYFILKRQFMQGKLEGNSCLPSKCKKRVLACASFNTMTSLGGYTGNIGFKNKSHCHLCVCILVWICTYCICRHVWV